MSDYLLEVGCEEIPARMVADAVADLRAALARRLTEADLEPAGPIDGFGGPRRIAVLVHALPERQPDRSERVTGPPADKAFDAEGRPTKAAIGFAQKLGIPVEKLERAETPKGVVLAGTKETRGRNAAEVLARLVPEAVLSLTFRKTMRWGDRDVRFVRAIRSVVSLLGTEIVPFELAGVSASRDSFGHRFLGARTVALASAQDYAAALGREHVVVDADERRLAIATALATLAAAEGGDADLDPELLAEVAELVEEPHVVLGRFDPAYLELPAEVLVTSMKHHQKSFPVKAPGGKLLPAFLSVTNVPDVEGHVVRGYGRVLNARLADARFFWNEDAKRTLESRLPGLERVVFHEKLGSYAAKVARLETLASLVAEELGASKAERQAAAAAARLAKTDLTTGMVGEFPELQGIVGGLYLRREGIAEIVAGAVYEHYLPASFEGAMPATLAGRALSIADKLDTLVGLFGAGLIPTGTRDPFGLRRAAQGVIRILLAADRDVALEPLLDHAARLHQAHPGSSQAAGGLQALRGYLVERVEHALSTPGPAEAASAPHRPDTLACVLSARPLSVRDAAARARAITAARAEGGFEATFQVLKRVANIAGTGGETAFARERFAPAEETLHAALASVSAAVEAAVGAGEHRKALDGIASLAAPLEQFFKDVLVMDPDPEVRENRLKLLRAIGALAAPIGDFGKLQVERQGA